MLACVTLSKTVPAALALGALLSSPAMAEGLAGTWLTGPDQKGQVAHVTLAPCGGAFCGHVLRTFNKSGQKITGPNDGKRVIWDMTAKAGGYEGKMLLPAYGATVKGRIEPKGNTLTIKGCLAAICKSTKWTRVN